jgi:polysaccharide export outer membrane protein
MIRNQLETSLCVLVVLAVMLAQPCSSAAQTSPGTTRIKSQQPTKIVAVPVPIAPSDLLEITVFDAPELTQQVRVGADGKVQLALIGNTQVAGLTAEQAAELITRELRDHKFLLHPQVNVLVKESSSQGVSITGEVQHPGVYQVLGARSLLDIVSMAGGLTNVADSTVTIKRRRGGEELVRASLKNDDAQSSLANDVQIYPGDLVMVPRAGIVYVLGDVNRPGGFVMQNNGKITLLQALAQAGGASATASVNHAVLLRKDGEGYVTTKLQLGRISRGQDGDMELHPNDIVFVPNNRLKSGLHSAENVATSIGSASIYAVVH